MMQRIWAFLDWCFFGPAANRTDLFGLLVRTLSYPYAVIRDLWHGDINLRAMSLVYTTLLSLIPLLAFSFAILKVFGAHHELEPIVYEFFRPVGADSATQLTARVMQFADRVSSGIVGSLGFALLTWTLLDTVKKVEDSFNYLWRVEQPRSFGRRIVEILSLLVVGPLVLVAFIGLSHATMNSTPVQEVAKMPFLDRLPDAAIAISPYVMVTVFFMGMYMFVPNTRVQWRPALVGALAGGFLWAAVGKMFTAFVVHATRLTIVYAGFAIIVVALLWTYLGWLILLAGAQLSFYIQNPTYLRVGTQELRLSCVELEQLALKMMYLVGQMHLNGGRRWTINRMSRQLQLPGIAVAKMARALERGGLIKITDDSELLCARDSSRIAVNDILEMARNLRSGHMPPRDAAVPAVDRLLAQIDAKRREHCSDLTLHDLVGDASPALEDTNTFMRPRLPPR